MIPRVMIYREKIEGTLGKSQYLQHLTNPWLGSQFSEIFRHTFSNTVGLQDILPRTKQRRFSPLSTVISKTGQLQNYNRLLKGMCVKTAER